MIEPGLESFPVFGRYSDNCAVQYFRFSGLQCPPAHEIAQIGMGKLRRGLEDRALVGIDPDANDGRTVAGLWHVSDDRIDSDAFQ